MRRMLTDSKPSAANRVRAADRISDLVSGLPDRRPLRFALATSETLAGPPPQRGGPERGCDEQRTGDDAEIGPHGLGDIGVDSNFFEGLDGVGERQGVRDALEP